MPGKRPWKVVLAEPAMRPDGTTFTDHDVHRYLEATGHRRAAGEWFKCSKRDVRAAVVALRKGEAFDTSRDWDFTLRPEQVEAVERTAAYFKRAQRERPGLTPHFLWNCKMRFGKTFAA